MIVVDTSAWVEFLRGTRSAAHRMVADLVTDDEILVPDVVQLEILAGARDEQHAQDLMRLLARFVPSPASSPADHEVAAMLYRRARREGQTVRSLVDCLVAAAALRHGCPVLAVDRDFDILASVSELQLWGR